MLKEFKEFAMKGNVIDMAIGVIVGGAFGKIVTSLVNDIIMPFFGFVTAGMDFKSLKWVLKEAVKEGDKIVKPEAAIAYGAFIQNIIDFLIIAFSIFMVIRLITKAKNRIKPAPIAEPEPEAPKAPTQEELLTEIRDLLKQNAETKQ